MKGTVFFFEDKKETGTNHPWFVISDPDTENNVLIVNATKLRNNSREDLSCVLNAGCHSNIIIKSYIAYSRAQEISIHKIYYLENLNKITIKTELLSESVLSAIQNGAKTTTMLTNKLKKYFSCF